MTPTQQGRFCNACAKEVVDFSTMTDIQVLNYFTNMTSEKVCGRALPEQLDRTISRPEPPKKRLFWYWNYFVMFFMFFAKGNNAKAQSCTKPATELSPLKNVELRGDVVVKGETQINDKQHVVSGKITDKDGNPVSFASIRVKRISMGVSADANGVYSIKIKPNSILVVSAAGFNDVEVVVGTQSFLNTILERNGKNLGEVVVTVAGGIRRTPVIEKNIIKPAFVFIVKEDNTDSLIENAIITIIIDGDDKSDTVVNEKKGIYKFSKFDEDETYLVKVEAAGYKANEFTIDANDFKDRKKEWEVLLRKKKTEPLKPLLVKTGSQTPIRLGGVIAVNKNYEPLYIVDGIITKKADEIKPEDIDDVTVLKGSEATALFGPDGANGAIVITTRKSKEKKLDTVAVSTEFKGRKMGGMTAGYRIIYLANTKAKLMTMLTDSLKVYPNPVQRNGVFSVALKLKEPGTYQIQFTDATGKIILQKQVNTVAKNHIETMVPQSWASGIYYVRAFNKTKLISYTSFIFE
jgi:TonB-dependent SusC/RagA subfamily outer membrane receptor